jgi:hypothetical protein
LALRPVTEEVVVLAVMVAPVDHGVGLPAVRNSMRKPVSLFERSDHERETELKEREVTEGVPGASGGISSAGVVAVRSNRRRRIQLLRERGRDGAWGGRMGSGV